MKTQYTIGEVAKLLGLTTDAVRFYEKKNIIHPQKNEDNNYRCYTMHNILELLDIIFYRHLDLSVADIGRIMHDGDQDTMEQLIRDKKAAVTKKIEQQKLLLKKLCYLDDMYASIRSDLGVCSLRAFAQSFIILQCDSVDFSIAASMPLLVTEQYELCSVIKRYSLPDMREEKDIVIVLDRRTAEDMGILEQISHLEKLSYSRCASTLIKMNDGKIFHEDIEPLLKWTQEQGLQPCGELLAVEIPAVSYVDTAHYFAELYLPVAEKIYKSP